MSQRVCASLSISAAAKRSRSLRSQSRRPSGLPGTCARMQSQNGPARKLDVQTRPIVPYLVSFSHGSRRRQRHAPWADLSLAAVEALPYCLSPSLMPVVGLRMPGHRLNLTSATAARLGPPPKATRASPNGRSRGRSASCTVQLGRQRGVPLRG